MPPSLPDAASIERVYEDLRLLFAEVAASFRGMTLAEFRDRWWADQVECRDRRRQARGAERRQRVLDFIPRDRRAPAMAAPGQGPH